MSSSTAQRNPSAPAERYIDGATRVEKGGGAEDAGSASKILQTFPSASVPSEQQQQPVEVAALRGALQRSLLENSSLKNQLSAAHSRFERANREMAETLALVEALKTQLATEKKRRSSMARLWTAQQQQDGLEDAR